MHKILIEHPNTVPIAFNAAGFLFNAFMYLMYFYNPAAARLIIPIAFFAPAIIHVITAVISFKSEEINKGWVFMSGFLGIVDLCILLVWGNNAF